MNCNRKNVTYAEAVRKTPNLMLFGNMCDFGCRLSDLKLIQKKIEEIEFEDNPPSEEDILMNYCFPDIPRNGFLVTLIMFTENEFKTIYNMLNILEEYPISWKHVNGNSFDKFLVFAKKLSKLILPDENHEAIRSLLKIRNCIVHSNSCVDDYSDEEKQVIDRFLKILTDCCIDQGFIKLSFQGIVECSDFIEQYISNVYRAAMQKYPESMDQKL